MNSIALVAFLSVLTGIAYFAEWMIGEGVVASPILAVITVFVILIELSGKLS